MQLIGPYVRYTRYTLYVTKDSIVITAPFCESISPSFFSPSIYYILFAEYDRIRMERSRAITHISVKSKVFLLLKE